MSTERQLVVTARRDEAREVVSLVLADAAGEPLPGWTAGAHVDVVVGPGLVRQYSLCGDPDDTTTWRVAVLREPAGRGGSVAVHDLVHEGSLVRVQGPRNHFPLRPAPAYLFVAGGIGITPILPMLRAADRASVPWRLAYGGRTTSSMAFVDELTSRGGAVELYPLDTHGLLPVAELVEWAGRNAADVYCCGPAGLIDAVEKEGRLLGQARVHVERFRPADAPAVAAPDPSRDVAFELEVLPHGVTLTVPADRSALEVLEDAGIAPLSSCREGTCGTCEVTVVAGRVDHRDQLLDEAERAADTAMFPCVSRALGTRLVIEV